MTARSARGTSTRARAVVLVFGESINDARAIASLIEALCPSLKGRVRSLPRPTSLQRSASDAKAAKWLDQLWSAVDAHRDPVACVFVHRDADGPDPLGRVEEATRTELQDAGIKNAYAVVPVEEIEAWWLLFPTATETLRASWSQTLPRIPGTVDSLSDPKRQLVERTGRKNSKKAYSEADSPSVAERVAAAIEVGTRPPGYSASYNRFVSSVDTCCSRAAG